MIESMNAPPVAPERIVAPAPNRESDPGPEENGRFADVLRERQTAAESEDESKSGVAPETGIEKTLAPVVQAAQPDPERGAAADAALGIGAAWLPPDLLLAIAQRDAATRRHLADAATPSPTRAAVAADPAAVALEAAATQANPLTASPSAKQAGGIRAMPEDRPTNEETTPGVAQTHQAMVAIDLAPARSSSTTRMDAQVPAARWHDMESASPLTAAMANMVAIAATEIAARQPAPASVLAMAIDSPVGSTRFAGEAAQRVVWLAQNGIGEAEIRVKPAELGPITVRLEMNRNEVTIQFAVSHPDTRMAVEDSLHRLEAMLAESGIALGGAHVGQEQAGGGFDGQRPGFARRSPAPVAALTPIASAPPPDGRSATRSLVDLFA